MMGWDRTHFGLLCAVNFISFIYLFVSHMFCPGKQNTVSHSRCTWHIWGADNNLSDKVNLTNKPLLKATTINAKGEVDGDEART